MRRSSRPVLAVLVGAAILAGCASEPASLQVESTAPVEGPAASTTSTSVAVEAPGAGTTAPTVAPGAAGAALSWRSCPDTKGFECATLAVPLDHAAPAGPTITIALNRHRAGDQAHRVGALVVNPGGPGGSGLELAASLPDSLPASILDRFDIVGFDPRGVGASRGISCTTDAAKDAALALPDLPTTRAELDAVVQARLDEGSACTGAKADVIPFLTTTAVARDLDLVRQALGEAKLTYLGFSYGTHIGATYAQLFPTRVRAFVLDGVVNPVTAGGAAGTDPALDETWTPAFERAFRRFAAACVAAVECAAKPDPVALRDSLLAEATANPIPAVGDARRVGPGLFVQGVAAFLYDHRYWPMLAVGLQDAANGDASILLRFVDLSTERDDTGHYASLLDANHAIRCADTAERTPVDAVKAASAALTLPVDRTALDEVLYQADCAGTPVGTEPFTPVGPATGSAPILLVGTDGDPATDVANTAPMAKALGVGVTLFWEGDGHTAFTKGSACIDDAVVAYLVDLTVPADGTRCPANPPGTANAPARGVAYGNRAYVQEILQRQIEQAAGSATRATCIAKAATEQLGEADLVHLLLQPTPSADLVAKLRAIAARC